MQVQILSSAHCFPFTQHYGDGDGTIVDEDLFGGGGDDDLDNNNSNGKEETVKG